MKEITQPDFNVWANHLYDRQDVAIALEQAFKQGYFKGYLNGAFEEKTKDAEEGSDS